MKARSMKLMAVALSFAMFVGLAGCEGQVPIVQASASSSATPDMSTAQEKKIRLAILQAIDDADAAKSTLHEELDLARCFRPKAFGIET